MFLKNNLIIRLDKTELWPAWIPYKKFFKFNSIAGNSNSTRT